MIKPNAQVGRPKKYTEKPRVNIAGNSLKVKYPANRMPKNEIIRMLNNACLSFNSSKILKMAKIVIKVNIKNPK